MEPRSELARRCQKNDQRAADLLLDLLYDRILKVSRTISDLEGSKKILFSTCVGSSRLSVAGSQVLDLDEVVKSASLVSVRVLSWIAFARERTNNS